MCHEPIDRPPGAPDADRFAVASQEEQVLRAADGNLFRAFSARTSAAEAPGIMILPDVRGLHPFYQDLALRFAEAGVHATALDYFGRTAGALERDESFDFMSHVRQLTPEGLAADASATLGYLRTPAGGAARPVYSVGFCMGGRLSFNQAQREDRLAGVIGFYGGPSGSGPDDPRAPIRLAPQYKCPVLGLFGGADPGIPLVDVERFGNALDAAGVANELVVYDGAPHSFFDRRYAEHQAACDDAWRRVLAFVGAGAGLAAP